MDKNICSRCELELECERLNVECVAIQLLDDMCEPSIDDAIDSLSRIKEAMEKGRW